MRCKLYIRGMEEPVELRYEEALAAQNMIASSSILSDAPFVIEGVWSGVKRDMRYVVFGKEKVYQKSEDIPVMPDEDAKKFETELHPFKKKAEEAGIHRAFYKDFWMVEQDAIRLDFFTVGNTENKSYTMTIKRLDLYDWCQNKLASFGKWQDKQMWLHRKDIEERDKLLGKFKKDVAKKMKI